MPLGLVRSLHTKRTSFWVGSPRILQLQESCTSARFAGLVLVCDLACFSASLLQDHRCSSYQRTCQPVMLPPILFLSCSRSPHFSHQRTSALACFATRWCGRPSEISDGK